MADMKLVFDILANDKATPVLGAVHKAAGGFGSALGEIGKIATGVVLGSGLTELPGKMLEFAKMAAEDEQAAVRVSSVLKTLPGDYEENNAAVNGAIAAGQKLAFSDNEIRDSYVKLAVATGNSEEAINRQNIAMDLARGANIPLADASKLLGKVTDENLQVFKRLGITLPDVANEADVLAAVQAKFAGQADAYASSTAGQFQQATIAFDETKEAIGYALLPALTAVGKVLADNLPKVQDFVTEFSAGFGPKLTDVLEKFGNIVGDVLSGDLGLAFDDVREMINEFGPQIADAVKGWAEAFVAWIVPMIPVFITEMDKFNKALIGWLADQIPPLIEALAEWAAAFIDWVGPQIPPLIRELGHLIEQMLSWVAANLPTIIAKLAEWGKAFVEWIAPRIPPMLAELGGLLLELGGWIATTALPVIIAKLVEWGHAFIDWVAKDVLPNLPGALATIASAIGSWISNTAASIGSWAVELGRNLVSGFVSGLSSLGSQLVNTISAAIRSIHVDFGWIRISGASGVTFNIPTPTIPIPNVPPLPGRAAGGPVYGGQAYLVGERGPEMFVPRQGGTIVPGVGGGGGPVVAGDIVIKLDERVLARVTRDELLKLGRRNGNAFGTLGIATP